MSHICITFCGIMMRLVLWVDETWVHLCAAVCPAWCFCTCSTEACSYILLSLIYISLTVNKGLVPFRRTWIPYVVSLRREELFMDMQIRLSSVVTGCRPNVLLIQMKLLFLSGRSHTNNNVVCLTHILMIILDFAVLLLFLLLKIKFTTPQNNIFILNVCVCIII